VLEEGKSIQVALRQRVLPALHKQLMKEAEVWNSLLTTQ
jgi:hypothetical protein